MPLLQRFKIVGHSMQPTLFNSDTILVSSLPYFFSRPKITDVIAFKNKKTSKVFIKRIEKISGEKYFVSGDNKHDSLDSRELGWIDNEDVIGKVIFKITQKSKFKSQNYNSKLKSAGL